MLNSYGKFPVTFLKEKSSDVREKGMQKLRSAITGFLIAMTCFFCMTVDLMAENRFFPEEIVEGVAPIYTAPPIPEGLQYAKSGSRGEAPGESENWKRRPEVVVSWGDEPTRVKIMGNSVLVPATLAHGGNEIDVYLLLDTGSTGTAIHSDIADQLAINLDQAARTKVQVVGGGVLNARVVRIGRLTVGPHTKRNWNIFVVPHKSSAARYDGLLGMDVLRGLKYEVDFKKQLIIWQ